MISSILAFLGANFATILPLLLKFGIWVFGRFMSEEEKKKFIFEAQEALRKRNIKIDQYMIDQETYQKMKNKEKIAKLRADKLKDETLD